MAKYVDCHLHLEDHAFDGTREAIIAAFKADDVDFVIDCGSDLTTSREAFNLAEKYDDIYAVVGCHPHEAKDFDDKAAEFFTAVSSHEKVVGIGEIGLDYHYDLSPRSVQKDVFEKQIVLADSLNLPIVIHTREAWKDTLDVLAANKKRLNNGVLFHCFNGSKETAKILVDKYDAYFSLGGAVTFKNFNGFDAIEALPRDRILTETDAPYMTPVPFRGKTNEPKYVALTVAALCGRFGWDKDEFTRQVKENTLRLFRIKR